MNIDFILYKLLTRVLQNFAGNSRMRTKVQHALARRDHMIGRLTRTERTGFSLCATVQRDTSFETIRSCARSRDLTRTSVSVDVSPWEFHCRVFVAYAIRRGLCGSVSCSIPGTARRVHTSSVCVCVCVWVSEFENLKSTSATASRRGCQVLLERKERRRRRRFG